MSFLELGLDAAFFARTGVPTKPLLIHSGDQPKEYTTVTAAIAGAVSGDIVLLPPITIDEAFTVTDGINVIGFSGVTILKKQVSMTGGGLHGVAILVPVGGRGVEWTGTGTNIGRISDVQLIGLGSGVGIYLSGTTTVIARDCTLNAGTLDLFISTSSTSKAKLERCVSRPSAACTTASFSFAGYVDANDCDGLAATTSAYLFISAHAQLLTCRAENATGQGYRIGAGSTVKLSACNATGNAQSLALVSGASTVDLIGCVLSSTTGYDIGVDASASYSWITVAQTVYDKSWGPESFFSSERWQATYFDTTAGEEALAVEGALSVGAQYKDSPIYYGQGQPYVTGLVVYHNSNGETGTWTDHTSDATIKAGAWGNSWTAYPDGNVNESIYFGSDHQVPALKIQVKAGAAGTYVLEGWDGSSWISIPSASYNTANYLEWKSTVAIDSFGTQNLRIGDILVSADTDPSPAWESLVKKTLNSVSKYWYRIRCTVPGGANGTLGMIYQWGHSGKISIYGHEVFGYLIRYHQIDGWNIGSLEAVDSAVPSHSDVRISTNIVLNSMWTLSNGAYDAVGGLLTLPAGIDHCRAAKLKVGFSVSTAGAGDVELTIRSNLSKTGDIYDKTAADTTVTTLTTLDAVDEKSYEEEIFGTILDSSNSPKLALTYGRNGPAAADTYGGNVRLNETSLYVKKYII